MILFCLVHVHKNSILQPNVQAPPIFQTYNTRGLQNRMVELDTCYLKPVSWKKDLKGTLEEPAVISTINYYDSSKHYNFHLQRGNPPQPASPIASVSSNY